MNILHIILLAVVQGLAELLPVSSSAHVIVAEKALGLDPTSPSMTLLLIALHTGTMFAVILYFWKSWKSSFFASKETFFRQVKLYVAATAATGLVGYPLLKGIEYGAMKLGHIEKAEIELLFGNLSFVAAALAAAGVLILTAGLLERKLAKQKEIGYREAIWMGAVQGLCLPFRGFSRSGSTISTGMLLGAIKAKAEEFSFALAVILTPAAVAKLGWRFIKAQHEAGATSVTFDMFVPSLLGMFFAFLAGLVALKWLSGWLEGGKWYLFGIYCLAASAGVYALHLKGF